jgi:hypothetical protein
MICVIESEQVKEEKIWFVFFENVFRCRCPDFILPSLGAGLERSQLLRRNSSGRN